LDIKDAVMLSLRFARFNPALLLLSATALAICQSSGQSTLERGSQAFKQGDLASAFKILKPLADAGNASAQELLGEVCYVGYDVGYNIPCNDAQAIQWYRLAAQNGNPKAQCRLGTRLRIDQKKDTEGFEWMLKSAKQGYPDCMCDIGEYYRGGWSPVTQNYSEALKWFKTAEEKGEACHYNLGSAYYFGQGVEVDFKSAAALLQKEASNKYSVHHADASELLASIYEQGGRGMEQNYSEAAKWYRDAIDAPALKWEKSSQDWARLNLGDLYVQGEGVPQDFGEALKLFKPLAGVGDARAQTRMGDLYAEGKGVTQSDIEAVKWYRMAAEQADPSGQFHLGMAYKSGKGVPEDYVLAHMWFNLAGANEKNIAPRLDQSLRDQVAREMTKEQIAEAQRLAREWKPKKPTEKK
jgi:TPR repeat protein